MWTGGLSRWSAPPGGRYLYDPPQMGNAGKHLVSLVMAAWNPRVDWFRDAVGSALQQTGCELELVVVDDGSTEPIESLLEGFEDPRLDVVRVPHGGAPRALNAVLPRLRGDYVRFIDADDVIVRDSTSWLIDLAAGSQPVISYGATVFCDERLRPRWKMTSRLQGSIARECLIGRFAARPHALLFPRSVVEATGQWDPAFTVSYDWDYVLRALDHAPVRGTRAAATLYRRHPGSSTANLSAGEEGAWRVLAKYLDRHPEARGTALERRARAQIYAVTARSRATHGQYREALDRLARGMRLYPAAPAFELALGARALAGRLRSDLMARLARDQAASDRTESPDGLVPAPQSR